MKFSDASLAGHEAERQRVLKAREKARIARRRGWYTGVLLIVALLAIGASLVALNLRQLASRRAAEAEEARANTEVVLEDTRQAKDLAEKERKRAEEAQARAEGALEEIQRAKDLDE